MTSTVRIQTITTDDSTGGITTAGSIATTGSTTEYLRGDGTFATPSGGGGASFSSVDVDLGTKPKTDGKFSITSSSLTAGKPVLVIDAAGPGGAYDDDKVVAYGIVTSSTNIDVYYTTPVGVGGTHTFKYMVGT